MVKEKNRYALWLLVLCWLAYTCSYIGKLSYSANINQVERAFHVSYKQAGLVSTFFFFAYGAGQIVNGILCKKYNVRWVVFMALILSCAMNVAVAVADNFSYLKWLWLVNGIATSFLWTSLVRLLSETLDKKAIKRAVVVMGTTVATGTFLVYGMSAAFVAVGFFRLTFYVAAGILLAVGAVWLCCFDRLVKPLKAEREKEKAEALSLAVERSGATAEAAAGASCAAGHTSGSVQEKKRGGFGMLPFFCMFALFAVVNNFVKDGLSGWTPDILDSIYDTPGWLSILLTLALPAFAIFGTVVAASLHTKISDFSLLCVVLFAAATALVGVVIGCLSLSMVLTVAIFAMVSCLMAGINSVITSMVPLYMKDKANSGMIAGVLNGFCYVGSTISSYSLGAVADGWGWNAVFYVLLAVCGGITVAGLGYFAFCKAKARRGQKRQEEN